MNEKNNASIEVAPKEEGLTVGGTLRKQRISMNVSVDKIAKDLRISKAYIEAIESDNFEVIPAAPYVRVYVKTIAEYLSLNPEKLLKQISNGSDKEFPCVEKETASEKNAPEKKGGGRAILVIILLVLLGLAAYFVNTQDYDWSGFGDYSVNGFDSEEIIMLMPDTDSLELNLPDSLIRGDTIIVDSVAAVINQKVEISLRVVRDSSWVEIVSDGRITNPGRILRSSSRVFSVAANDSINLRVGVLGAVEIFANGNRVETTGATGFWTFTREGARVLTQPEWQRVRRVPQ